MSYSLKDVLDAHEKGYHAGRAEERQRITSLIEGLKIPNPQRENKPTYHKTAYNQALHDLLKAISSPSEGEDCGEWRGKDAYDCDRDGARIKPGMCRCHCHQHEGADCFRGCIPECRPQSGIQEELVGAWKKENLEQAAKEGAEKIRKVQEETECCDKCRCKMKDPDDRICHDSHCPCHKPRTEKCPCGCHLHGIPEGGKLCKPRTEETELSGTTLSPKEWAEKYGKSEETEKEGAYKDHSHCWEQNYPKKTHPEGTACGIKVENHIGCCLCGKDKEGASFSGREWEVRDIMYAPDVDWEMSLVDDSVVYKKSYQLFGKIRDALEKAQKETTTNRDYAANRTTRSPRSNRPRFS